MSDSSSGGSDTCTETDAVDPEGLVKLWMEAAQTDRALLRILRGVLRGPAVAEEYVDMYAAVMECGRSEAQLEAERLRSALLVMQADTPTDSGPGPGQPGAGGCLTPMVL